MWQKMTWWFKPSFFQESGFSTVELNASDTRSKRSLKEEVAEALGNQTVVDYLGKSLHNFAFFVLAII